MAYDAHDGYVVMFGGFNTTGVDLGTTWTYSGGAWTQLHPSNSPSPRRWASMAYDSTDGYTVLFGGAHPDVGMSDTWVFQAGQWTELSTATAPPARSSASMVDDPGLGGLLLFGGTSNHCCSGAGLGDTWVFSGGVWTRQSPAASPPDVNEYGLSYDPSLAAAVLFGGWLPGGSCGNTVGQTWQYKGGNWVQDPTPGGPGPRQGPILVDLPTSNLSVLFGGITGTCGTPTDFYTDTWTYGAAGWQNVTTSLASAPGPTTYAYSCYDAKDRYILLFGGDNTSSARSDVWVFGAIGPSYNVTFRERGLPIGVNWSVSAQTSVSNTTVGPVPARGTITLSEPKGLFAFAIGSPTGFGVAKIGGVGSPNQTSGNVTGQMYWVVTFGKLETLGFSIVPTPNSEPYAGSTWWVNLTPALATGGPAPLSESTVTGMGSTQGFALDSGRKELFVPDSNTGVVGILSDRTYRLLATVDVGGGTSNAVYDSARGQVFIAENAANRVAVVSDASNQVVASVPVCHPPSQGAPNGLAYDSAKGEVFVSCYGTSINGLVSVINDTTDLVTANITVGVNPEGLAYDSGRGEIFVANDGTPASQSVSIISDSTNGVVATVPVGAFPNGLAYDPVHGDVFVGDAGSNDVRTISDSTNSVVATIPVGSYPGGDDSLAYDSTLGQVWVTNQFSNSVTVISTGSDSVVQTVNVGSEPHGIVYDELQGSLFVGYDQSSTLSTIIPGSATTVGQPIVWTGLNLEFTVASGAAYHFSVSDPGSVYAVHPVRGTVYMPPRTLAKLLRFQLITQTVIFRESGLAPGSKWTVTIDSGTSPVYLFPIDSSLTGAGNIRFLLPVGSYNFTVGVSGHGTPSPTTGTVQVTSAPAPPQIVPVSIT